jgi:hypothetical protein
MSNLRELFAMLIVATVAYFITWAAHGTTADSVIIALIMWTSLDHKGDL